MSYSSLPIRARISGPLVVMLLGVSMLFSACYPGSPETTGELDVVITAHDSTANFAGFRTYAMADTVIHYIDEENPDNNVPLSREFDSMILSTVHTNLSNLGYQRIAIASVNPDDPSTFPGVVVLVGAQGQKNVGAYTGWSCGGYWGWYWWYPPGYGCWYPYPTTQFYSYSTGTLRIDMFNVAKSDADRVANAWVGGLNGLLSTSASTSSQRLQTGINQAFQQSPYLKTGN